MKIRKSKWYIQRLTTLTVLAWVGEFAGETEARKDIYGKPEFNACTVIKGEVLQRCYGDKIQIETVKPEVLARKCIL